MKDIFIPNPDSAIERINYMSSVAYEPVPDYRYEKIMSEDDIAEERETFADLSIELQRLEIEKAELVADMNKRIKEKREAAKVSLALIRTGRMEVVETVYLIKKMKGYGKSNGMTLKGIILVELLKKFEE